MGGVPAFSDENQNGKVECKLKATKILPNKWYSFSTLTPVRSIIRGTSSIIDKRFKILSRGRQASAASVVAIVHAHLFEPRDWISAFVDRSLEYGDRLFRVSQARGRVPDDVYMTTNMLETEFFVGDYKCKICIDPGVYFGNLLSETKGAPKLEYGLKRFFEGRNFGVLTTQGMSMAIWNHPLDGFFYFDPHPTDEEGKRDTGIGYACLIRSNDFEDLMSVLQENLNFKFDSRYCLDKVILVKVKPVGRGKYHSQCSGDLIVEKKVLQAINPVDIEENKADCTKKAPKGDFTSKPPKSENEIVQEIPLKIEITNCEVEKKFAADPLVDQKIKDERYTYDDVRANVPDTFIPVPGDDSLMILHGWTHDCSNVYKAKGAQGVANCVMAMGMKVIHPVRTWLRKTLDEVLVMGDAIYGEIKAEKPGIKNMTASDLDDARIKVDGNKLIVNVDILTVVGTIVSKNPTVLNLKQGLEEFFIKDTDGILECLSMAIAIWTQEDYFYMFDSRACDITGLHLIENKEKGKNDKNAKGAVKKIGRSCVMRFPSLAALTAHYLKNLDPTKSNDRFTIRRIEVVDDVPGIRDWNSFRPAAKGISWILKGNINNENENFEDHSRGVQGLAIPVVALIAAKIIKPSKWTKDDVDDTIKEGDAYYNWCIPFNEDGEARSEEEKILTLKTLKKSVYYKKCKALLNIKESRIVGDLKAQPDNDVPNLEKAIHQFFNNCQYGVVEYENKYFGIWKKEEELKDKTIEIAYYLFNEKSNDTFSRQAQPESEEINVNACILRFLNPNELTILLKNQYIPESDSETEAGNDDNNEPCEFFVHEIEMASISEPMSDEDIEKDMQTPIRPELRNYTAIGDDGAFLSGSFNQMNELLFKSDTRDKQQAANALVTLAMTKIFDPFLWHQEVVDDILKMGDKLSDDNAKNLPGIDDEDPDNARFYLNPSEINREFPLGVNNIIVDIEEESAGGKMNDITKILEDFFYNSRMGIFRQDNIMLPIWKEDTVFFTMNPRGTEDGNAAIYWFIEEHSLAEFLTGCVETADGEFVIDAVNTESKYTESEKPEENFITDDKWHGFAKVADGVWKIEGTISLDDESFDEDDRGKQSAAVCVIGVVFSKVYEPRHWTADIFNEVTITGEKLHSRNAERMGKNESFYVNEIISEFFISNRRIDLIIQDCVEAGIFNGRKPNIQNIFDGVTKFFKKSKSGCIMMAKSLIFSIWKYDDDFYCLEPGLALMRFEDISLLIEKLLNHGKEDDDFEITGVDIVDWNKLSPWKFDPSPAVRPSNIPALNAYSRLPGRARAILRGSTHQASEIFGEGIAGRQTAANCIISLAMSVIKNPTTWTRKTLDEVLAIGTNLHRESMKCVSKTCTLKPKEIVRIFHIGVNVMAADIETSVSGIVAEAPPPPDVKGKKGKKVSKKASGKDKKKKGRERTVPAPPKLLEEGLHKFFEDNNAGILVTGRYMVAIWKDSGVYFMFDPRSRNSEGMKDDEDSEGRCCAVWFACKEPLFDLVHSNINDDEKYAKYNIYRVIIRTVPIETLPLPCTYKAINEPISPPKETDCPNPPVFQSDLQKQRQPKKKLNVEIDKSFIRCDKELSYLLATTHIDHHRFPSENRSFQTTAVAATAIVASYLHAPSTWSTSLIDAILKYGDILHTECVRLMRPGARNLSVSELLDVFVVGDVRAKIHIHRNIAAGILLEEDLVSALKLFFSVNKNGIMHTSTYAIPLMEHWSKYYFLDPTEKNKMKKDSFEGVACLFKCESISKLAKVIVNICAFKEPTVYTLNAIHLLDLYFFSR